MGAAMRQRTLRRARGSEGTTLTELMVAAAAFSLVSMAVLESMVSFTKQDREQDRIVAARRDVRAALREMTRDLRMATAISAWSSVATATSQIEITTTTPDGAGTAEVQWRLSSTALVREVLNGVGGSVVETRTVLSATTNVADGVSLLRYFDSTTAELSPSTSSSATIANTTYRIRVTIAVNPGTNRTNVQESGDVELRNRSGSAATSNAQPGSGIGTGWSSAMTATSPLGWWRFEESSGTTASNSGSGSTAMDGTYVTSPTSVTGFQGGTSLARSFPGSGSVPYVDLGTASLTGAQSAWTMAAWVYPLAPLGSSASEIVRKQSASDSKGFRMWLSSTAVLNVAFGTGTSTSASTSSSTLGYGRWSFVVATYDGTTVTAYVNGASATTSATSGSIDLGTSAERAVIGAFYNSGSPSNGFSGRIDEVAVWARALTSTEVLSLYRAAG